MFLRVVVEEKRVVKNKKTRTLEGDPLVTLEEEEW